MSKRHTAASLSKHHTAASLGTCHTAVSLSIHRTGASLSTRRIATSLGTRHTAATIRTNHISVSLSTHHSETSLGIRHSVASLSIHHTAASLSTRHTTVSLGTRHIDVRRRSSGLGRLPSQSCDEGRTNAPKLERVRRSYLFGNEETLGRSVFVHSSVMSKFTLVRIHRLVVLVVRRPPRERKVPGSNPACAGIFFGVESYQ